MGSDRSRSGSRPHTGERHPRSSHTPTHRPALVDDSRRQELKDVIGTAIAPEGLVVEDVEIRSVGHRWLLRVLVDADHGVDLDHVAGVARDVSAALDNSDVLNDLPYTLEVSSPGVDRPLREPRHWRRNIGRLTTVTVGHSTVVGRVLTVADDAVTLDVDGERRVLPYAQIGRAVVEVEFRRDPAVAAAAEPVSDPTDSGGDDGAEGSAWT